MSIRIARPALAALAVALLVPAAGGYIHFPPMTLKKMCQISHHIRVLKVMRFDKDKGVIDFEVADTLKGKGSRISSFRHVVGAKGEGAKTVLGWVASGKRAVLFAIEGNTGGTPRSIGYVFIDEYCYSVDYNGQQNFWLMIRGEPGLSACYHGAAEKLPKLVKDVLDGKEVKVPVKKPDTKENRDTRNEEVNDALKKNR